VVSEEGRKEQGARGWEEGEGEGGREEGMRTLERWVGSEWRFCETIRGRFVAIGCLRRCRRCRRG
jgi:hypothetical protein